MRLHSPDITINPALALRFFEDRWQLHLPETGKNYDAGPSTFELLNLFSKPVSSRDADAYYDRYSAETVDACISDLLDRRILIQRGTEDPLIDAWSSWTAPSWLLHMAGRKVRFATSDDEQDLVAKKVAQTPPPSNYKCSCSQSRSVRLPEPRPLDDVGLTQTFLQRRTCRLYDTDKAITLQDLSDVLYYAGGVVFENDTVHFGTVLKKCSPSPGARHSVEIYPVISRCQDVDPGAYHYCVQHHALNLVSAGDKQDLIDTALQSQPYFTAAAAACFFSCVTPRLKWKYAGPRIYRLAHLEVGHYCQNFLLAGTGIGLGVYSTGAIDEVLVEKELCIDGVDEVVLYVAGLGHMQGDSPYIRPGGTRVIRVPAGHSVRLPGKEETAD